jgi:hypothetical protein
MAPTAAALIHLPPEELPAGCLQLPDGGGEILNHEADDGTGGEVRVVLVAWAKHFEADGARPHVLLLVLVPLCALAVCGRVAEVFTRSSYCWGLSP